MRRGGNVVMWLALIVLLAINGWLLWTWLHPRPLRTGPPEAGATPAPGSLAGDQVAYPADPRAAYLALLTDGNLDLDQAWSWFEIQVQQAPQDPIRQALLGGLYAAGGKTAESQAALSRALQADAKCSLAICFEGDLALRGGDMDKALGQYRQAAALARNPVDQALARRRAGVVEFWKNDPAAARQDFDQALAAAQRNLDQARSGASPAPSPSSGRGGEADPTPSLPPAARRVPPPDRSGYRPSSSGPSARAGAENLVALILSDQALLADTAGQTAQAADLLRRARAQAPDLPVTALRLADFYRQHRDYAAAEQTLQDAARRQAPGAVMQDELLQILLAAGKKSDAQRLALPYYHTYLRPDGLARTYLQLKK